MRDIDWNEAMHISKWYAWKRLKHYSIVLGNSEIVSETMLSLVKTDAKIWEKFGVTTVVCNKTRWTALRLYEQHKKRTSAEPMAAMEEFVCEGEIEKEVFSAEFMDLFRSAKSLVIKRMKNSIGEKPSKPSAVKEWEIRNEHTLRRIERYEACFLEQKITNDETLESVGQKLGVTRERVRQMEVKFWLEIQQAFMHMYGLPLDHIADLLIAGERIK